MKKKVLSIVVCVLLLSIAFVAGCTSAPQSQGAAPSSQQGTDTANAPAEKANDASAAAPDTAKGKLKIAVVVKDSASGWFVRMEKGLKDFAEKTGNEVFMKGPQETDAAQQIEIIQNVITNDIDILCVVPVDPAACENVLKEAQDKGIVVICHEGSSVNNCNYDIEAFNNMGYGGYIMDKLASLINEEGVYTTMVGFLTNASHNEWADGAVARQKEAYSNMELLAELPRVESENNSEKAYEAAKEVLKKYPQIKGFTGSSSLDTPGIARAINEMGLQGKVFVVGTGMPNECRSLIKDGSLTYVTLWDPAEAGYAMCEIGVRVKNGETIGEGTNLGLDSYSSLVVDPENPKVLMGAGWISVDITNVDDYDF